jgi:hypothetical protein
MPFMEGLVTIVQESRFQLTDDRGVAHLFVLDHGASVEAGELTPLRHHQWRVRVDYHAGNDMIGNVACSVAVCGIVKGDTP